VKEGLRLEFNSDPEPTPWVWAEAGRPHKQQACWPGQEETGRPCKQGLDKIKLRRIRDAAREHSHPGHGIVEVVAVHSKI